MQDVGVVIRPRISSYPENARSNRAPATNSRTSGPSWGQHKGADDPCKIVVVGALPTVSTNSFPSSHLGEGGRLLTGEAWFETRGGSHPTSRRAASAFTRVFTRYASALRRMPFEALAKKGHAPFAE